MEKRVHEDEVVGVHEGWERRLLVVEVAKGAEGTGSIEGRDQPGMAVVAEEEYCKAVAKRDLIDGVATAKVHEVHCFQPCEMAQSFGEAEVVQGLSK